MSIVEYIPFVLLFALATALIYIWGLWRSQRQQQDLSNLLSSKGITHIKRALKKNQKMNKSELKQVVQGLTASQPFSKERIQVTDPSAFLDSLLPYMLRQHLIHECHENGQTYYMIRK